MGDDRDQIVFRCRFLALFKHRLEDGLAFEQLVLALLPAVDETIARRRRDDVGPACQTAALLQRKIEQRREHQGRQLDRDTIDPVECLANREAIQDILRPLADQRFKLLKILGRDRRAYHLAMNIVTRGIHAEEIRHVEPVLRRRVQGRVIKDETADACVRRKDLVVRVDGDAVVEAGDRPECAVGALRAVMHRGLIAQALEIRMHGLTNIKIDLADIDLIDRERAGDLFVG